MLKTIHIATTDVDTSGWLLVLFRLPTAVNHEGI